MTGVLAPRRTTTGAAATAGTVVGLVVVCLYLVAGVLLAGWSVGDFLEHLSVGTVGYFVGMIGLTVAFVGLPIAGYLRFRLITPLGVLGLALLGWVTLAAVQGLLAVQTIFGLALYAVIFSPVALVLYGVFGGGEYLLRTRYPSVSP